MRTTGRLRTSMSIAICMLLFPVCGRVKRPRDANAPWAATQTVRSVGPLPDRCYQVRWAVNGIPGRGVPVATALPLDVTVTNLSSCTWPDPPTADARKDGSYAVRLTYRWTREGSKTMGGYGPRYDLPNPVRAGESYTFHVVINTPPAAGQWQLQLDLVQELVAFFESKGAERWVRDVNVR